jgi:hypothetical protein
LADNPIRNVAILDASCVWYAHYHGIKLLFLCQLALRRNQRFGPIFHAEWFACVERVVHEAVSKKMQLSVGNPAGARTMRILTSQPGIPGQSM